MLKRIHVDQHAIKRNQKHGTNDPPISVKTYKSNTKAFEVDMEGPSKLVYRPDKPLSCGARLWIETEGRVIADGKDIDTQEHRDPFPPYNDI